MLDIKRTYKKKILWLPYVLIFCISMIILNYQVASYLHKGIIYYKWLTVGIGLFFYLIFTINKYYEITNEKFIMHNNFLGFKWKREYEWKDLVGVTIGSISVDWLSFHSCFLGFKNDRINFFAKRVVALNASFIRERAKFFKNLMGRIPEGCIVEKRINIFAQEIQEYESKSERVFEYSVLTTATILKILIVLITVFVVKDFYR